MEMNLQDEQKSENIQVHNTEHMITAFVKETYLKLPLPMTAVPSFITKSGSQKRESL
jgi:hypothetical protein